MRFRLLERLALDKDDVLPRVLLRLLLDQLAPPPFPDEDLGEGERRLVLVLLFDIPLFEDELNQLAPPPELVLFWVVWICDFCDVGFFGGTMPNDCF